MKYLFIFCFYAIFYVYFEMIFNLIAKLLKWYDFNPDRKLYTLYTSASLWMSIVGGLVGLALYGVYCIPIFQSWNYIIPYCLICGIIITAAELGSGFLFNIKYKMSLWDYSKEPFNYKGQISVFRSSCWVLAGLEIFPINSFLNLVLK